MDIIVIIIGVLGSLASIYGAYLAINAKNEAVSSAAIAESAKNEVLKKQKTTSLIGIMFEAKRTQQIFGKYAIAQSNKSLAGVQFDKDSENLQDFIFQFNENREMIEQNTELETEATYKSLNQLLSDFSDAKSAGDKKDYGKQIRLMIDDIIFKMRKSIDNRNEE
jgi:lipopolysaccharide export LptBFGC system permease protein LptF